MYAMPVMSKATQRHAATSSHLLSAPLPVFMTFLIICSCSLHTLIQLACICNLLGRWAAHREQLLCESSTDRYEERAHALQRERKQDRQIQKLVSTKSEFLLNHNPLLTCDLELTCHPLSLMSCKAPTVLASVSWLVCGVSSSEIYELSWHRRW